MNKEEILKELGIIQNKLFESQAKANNKIILSSIEKRNTLEEKISKIKIEEQQNQIEITKAEASIDLNKEKIENVIGTIAALGEEMQAIEEGPDFNRKTGVVRAKITNLRKKKDKYLENVNNDIALLEDYNLRSKIAKETLASSTSELEDVSKSFDEKTAIESIIEDVKNDKLTDEELLSKMVTLRESMSDDFYNNDMLTINNEIEENKELQTQCEAEIQQYEAKLADEGNYPVIARANSRNIESINKENEKLAAYHVKLEESKLENLTYDNKNTEIDKNLSINYQEIKKLNDEKNILWFKLSHTSKTSDNYKLLIDSIHNKEIEIRTIETSNVSLEDEKEFNNNIIKIVNDKQDNFNKLYAGLTANLDQRNNNVVSAAKQADQDKLQQAKDALIALKNRGNYINSYLEEDMYNFEDKLQASIDAKNNSKKVSEQTEVATETAPIVEPVVTEPAIQPFIKTPEVTVSAPVERDDPFATKEKVSTPIISGSNTNLQGPIVGQDYRLPKSSKIVETKDAKPGLLAKIKSSIFKNKFVKWAALILALIMAVGIYAGYEMFECLQGKEPIPTSSLFDAGVSEQTINDYTEALNATDTPTVVVTPTGTTISTQSTTPTHEPTYGTTQDTTETIFTPIVPTETTTVPTETTVVAPSVPTETTITPTIPTGTTVTPTVPTETTVAPTIPTGTTVTPTIPTETTIDTKQRFELTPTDEGYWFDSETYYIYATKELQNPFGIISSITEDKVTGIVYIEIDTTKIPSMTK